MSTWDVIEGDCLDVMRGMADASVDLIFTDPPYNVGIGGEDWDAITGYRDWSRLWFKEARRIATTVAFTPGTPNIHMWLDIEEPTHWLCHWKPNAHQQNQCGFIHWEPVLVYGPRRGRRRTNVLRAPIVYEKQAEPHPCPKPTELARQAIRLLSPAGGLVIDPFVGSGTTGMAAVELGHPFIGIEQSAQYCEIARRRLAGAMSPLFTDQDHRIAEAAAQPRLAGVA